MPSKHPRVQTLCPPDVYAAIQQLARKDQRSMSHTVVSLMEHALRSPEIRAALEEARATEGEVPETYEWQPRYRLHSVEQWTEPQAADKWWEA